MRKIEREYLETDVVARFKNVSKRFGDFTAVSDVNFEIYRGEVLGFLGPNGAGKSTTMKMMAFLLKPTEGEIFIRGNGELQKMTRDNKDLLLDNIGFLIENPAFYGNMTPRQVLKYFAELKGYPQNLIKQRVEEVVAMVKLTKWIDKKIKTFSKGMRQKIGIVSAIVHDPEIIVLDEPHTGLDPKARSEVREFIVNLKKKGKTVFLSSHLLYEVSEVADRVAMINKGKLIACDTLENLESKAKRSIIQVELFQQDKQEPSQVIETISQIISPLITEKQSEKCITYNADTEFYEILFDGSQFTQKEILKKLIINDVEITDFSVPNAGLLEDLYLSLVSDLDKSQPEPQNQRMKNSKNITEVGA
ncbi:Vitamin B12 import ATP-binding protein BtuD [Candidatus Lokiarchaeum ossiferum]|uniref:Vitamin B12 import ATP-binding protein BtuD n=1 Tax=Candidatus Lokiarchaeum ossiferum TaxID=2951803 RepID=A0ABY6HYX3_9ARCH|nr:Vitamin B12 import ATP-binding protein BtuD [Candidatus Lokiarchaeum sp. B-35]